MISCESVLNRVYNFAGVCPNYKQGVACPKQGNKIELAVLNRVCILGFFCPKQGQGFKPSAAHLYPNMNGVPPPGLHLVILATFTTYQGKVPLPVE